MKFEWQQMDHGTWRAKVIGGWLILHVKTWSILGNDSSYIQSESMVFVTDLDHKWVIEE